MRRGITLLLFVAWVASCGGGTKQARRPGPRISLELPALDGGRIHTERYRGRVVVLHFMTTWSIPAGLEVQALIDAHRRYPKDLTVIAVVLDPGGYRLVAPWRNSEKIPYLVALASDELRAGRTGLGRIRQVPTTVILDRGGRLAYRFDAPVPPETLRRSLAELLERG